MATTPGCHHRTCPWFHHCVPLYVRKAVWDKCFKHIDVKVKQGLLQEYQLFELMLGLSFPEQRGAGRNSSSSDWLMREVQVHPRHCHPCPYVCPTPVQHATHFLSRKWTARRQLAPHP